MHRIGWQKWCFKIEFLKIQAPKGQLFNNLQYLQCWQGNLHGNWTPPPSVIIYLTHLHTSKLWSFQHQNSSISKVTPTQQSRMLHSHFKNGALINKFHGNMRPQGVWVGGTICLIFVPPWSSVHSCTAVLWQKHANVQSPMILQQILKQGILTVSPWVDRVSWSGHEHKIQMLWKFLLILFCVLIIQPGHKFACVMTALLSWHMHICDLKSLLYT